MIVLSAWRRDPTEILGKVTDMKTGNPVQGATVKLCKRSYQPDQNNDCITISLSTDAEGKFRYRDEKGKGEFYILAFTSAPNYIDNAHSFEIIENTSNTPEIQLAPLDGILKVTVKNESGLHDSIYCRFINPYFVKSITDNYDQYQTFYKYPLYVPAQQSYTQVIKLTSEVFTTISWNFKNNASESMDSVYINLKDTTYYEIKI